MRVTGGIARGLNLASPKAPGVRPTTDRVRAALFNIMSRFSIENSIVADLFAGTGSLGIEALSRGAQQVDFVEEIRRQIEVIRTNLHFTGFSNFATLYHSTVETCLPRLQPYDIMLMDPPYTQPFPNAILTSIGELGLLKNKGILVCGHSSRIEINKNYGTLECWDNRRYGDSSLAFFSYREEDAK